MHASAPASPSSPAAAVGRAQAHAHPRALAVGVGCDRVDVGGGVRCVVGVEQRDGTRRCATVHLTPRGRRWLLDSWRRTPACAPLPAPRHGLFARYD
jgi:hypothetical protein